MVMSDMEYLEWLWKQTINKCTHCQPKLIRYSNNYYEIQNYSEKDMLFIDCFKDILIFKYGCKVQLGVKVYDH